MDKETRTFIEAQMKAQLEDITGVIREMGTALETRMTKEIATLRDEAKSMEKGLRQDMEILKMDVSAIKRETANLKLEFEEARTEVQETRAAVLRLEHTLQDKLEAHEDEIQDTRQRIERIEKHLGLPRSLAA
jgi:DNA repair exonuclease SbcCD ATPase subunit